MFLIFPNDWRKLRKLITWLLKAKLATQIIKLNYVQSYTLTNNTVEKQQEKLIYIQTEDQEKTKSFITKSFPEAKICFNPPST